jgi:hypothetical protein
MVLETLQGLRGAVALYAKLGFTRTSSYCANPLPGELRPVFHALSDDRHNVEKARVASMNNYSRAVTC